MFNTYFYKILCVCSAVLLVAGINASHAQYISEVLEYKPAPGQLINEAPWGTPSAAGSITGGINGHLSLGAWGGYVVFKFATPVENHPDNPFGVDFTVFGNPMPDWSEPGIVWVMRDDNQNGLADDTWYQLAGSDYYFSGTVHNYRVSYTNPQVGVAANVPWSDNLGNSGYIYANDVHPQPYYPLADSFPEINQEAYSFTASRIFPAVDSTSSMVKIYQRGFGYADNEFRGEAPYDMPDNPYTQTVENSGGDAFDLNWAVDTAGNYVQLDEVDFVKVQNGMLAHGGWLGEVSTEITGAVDVAPNATITGETLALVIKDLPPVIYENTLQLEVYAFDQGRLIADYDVNWSVNLSGASVDGDNILHLTQSGELEVTATLAGFPNISATATAAVDLGNGFDNLTSNELIDIYPNPFADLLNVKSTSGELRVYNGAGHVIYQKYIQGSERINMAAYSPGLYLVQLNTGSGIFVEKVIKK